MTTTVDKSDLEFAFDFVCAGTPGEHSAYLDRSTGKFLLHSEYVDSPDELPDDLDPDRYLEIPHKKELGIANKLVFSFVIEHLPSRLDEVEGIFHRRGAYRRYKDLLERCGLLERWYAYEEEAMASALRDWCAYSQVEVKE